MAGVGTVTVLQSNDLKSVNGFDQKAVVPKESQFNVKSKTFPIAIAPYSFSVLRIKLVPEQKSMKK